MSLASADFPPQNQNFHSWWPKQQQIPMFITLDFHLQGGLYQDGLWVSNRQVEKKSQAPNFKQGHVWGAELLINRSPGDFPVQWLSIAWLKPSNHPAQWWRYAGHQYLTFCGIRCISYKHTSKGMLRSTVHGLRESWPSTRVGMVTMGMVTMMCTNKWTCKSKTAIHFLSQVPNRDVRQIAWQMIVGRFFQCWR